MSWWVMAVMALVTFSCRFSFFNTLINFNFSSRLQRLLSFAAPAVLTAMWAPIVFMSNGQTLVATLWDPFLIAGLATVLMSIVIRQTLLVVILGMGLFVAMQYSVA